MQPYKALVTWKEYKADEFDIRQLIKALDDNLKTELAYMARDIMQSKSHHATIILSAPRHWRI